MNLKSLALTPALVLAFCCSASGQTSCQYWQSRVDVMVSLPDLQFIDQGNPDNIMQAIECLLMLEGNKNMAAFGRKIEPLVSQPLPSGPVSQLYTPVSVEVAALYFISYLYYQKWDHAGWVILVGKDNPQDFDTSADSVKKAYGYYRGWFKQVKSMGIVKARELKIEPLKDKDVRWR